jgi:hypothetical protein
MEHLHALCDFLDRQVSAVELDRAMIMCTTIQIEQTMLSMIANGTLSQYKYCANENVDLVFEALCLTKFDRLFQTELPKYSHITKRFEQQALPYWLAGALVTPTGHLNLTSKGASKLSAKTTFRTSTKILPKEFIIRFRTRRYSYMHNLRRHEVQQQQQQQQDLPAQDTQPQQQPQSFQLHDRLQHVPFLTQQEFLQEVLRYASNTVF